MFVKSFDNGVARSKRVAILKNIRSFIQCIKSPFSARLSTGTHQQTVTWRLQSNWPANFYQDCQQPIDYTKPRKPKILKRSCSQLNTCNFAYCHYLFAYVNYPLQLEIFGLVGRRKHHRLSKSRNWYENIIFNF